MSLLASESFWARRRGNLDGVRRGSAPRTLSGRRPVFATRSLATPSLPRARKQLDAVLLRERERRGVSSRTWRLVRIFLWRRFQVVTRRFMRHLGRLLPDLNGIPPKKALAACLIGGISFGMVMTSLFHSFTDSEATAMVPVQPEVQLTREDLERELGFNGQAYDPNDDIFLQFFSEAHKEEYSAQIKELVQGYPIEDMLPYILEKDRIVAAFLIGIAKKESNWGKRIPVLAGQDCFNYWGYRGVRRLMGTGGHTCFNSKKDAVDTVAFRLEKLIHSNKLDTPAKMVIWKCGYSCDGHSRESVRKWIADVDLYFRELQGDDEEEGLVLNPSQ